MIILQSSFTICFVKLQSPSGIFKWYNKMLPVLLFTLNHGVASQQCRWSREILVRFFRLIFPRVVALIVFVLSKKLLNNISVYLADIIPRWHEYNSISHFFIVISFLPWVVSKCLIDDTPQYLVYQVVWYPFYRPRSHERFISHCSSPEENLGCGSAMH